MNRFEAQITFVRVRELDRSARFYEETMGLELALDQTACRIYRTAPGGYLGICEGDPEPATRSTILTLVTADVDGWYERLRGAGVDFQKPPGLHERFGIYHCFLRDPDGWLIEIQRFETPPWRPGVAVTGDPAAG